MREGLRVLGSEQEEMGKDDVVRDEGMGIHRRRVLFRW